MLPTPYETLNLVLSEFVTRVRNTLGNDLVGAYLQGSFAVGDFDRHSDVDFIVVVAGDLASDQVEALQVMHGQVHHLDSEWARKLEGSYFPREILRDSSKRGAPLWYLDNGASSLIQSDHCNSAIVRWIVREKGVVLAGLPPRNLMDPISEESLKMEMLESISNWGKKILDTPRRYNNRYYQSFIVLCYCRMLHDLYRGYPGSKREGADWAKSALDPAWSDLIDGAWRGRSDPIKILVQPADPRDFENTLEFVRLMMDRSRLYVAGVSHV